MIKVNDLIKYLENNRNYKLNVRMEVGYGEWVIGREIDNISIDKDDEVVYLELEGSWEEEEEY